MKSPGPVGEVFAMDGPMTVWVVAIAAAVLIATGTACLALAIRAARWDRVAEVAGRRTTTPPISRSAPLPWMRSRPAVAGTFGILVGSAGWLFAGPIGGVIGVVTGVAGSSMRRSLLDRRRLVLLEEQLAEMSESVGMGLRSGLSVVQALDFARAEAVPPLRGHLDRFMNEQLLGVPFPRALARLGEDLGTDDARFLVLVTGIHARSGGDLAGALHEVGRTIRHRIAIRRELRAASAQGRISGVIMGSLPIAFFLFLSITSHSKLAPVLRSGPGMAMVGSGLFLEGVAYLWIRRLLRVEV